MENIKFWCRCCGTTFTKQEGLEHSKTVGEARPYVYNGKEFTRRVVMCPNCSAPKKFLESRIS